jgi:hypothetical protein
LRPIKELFTLSQCLYIMRSGLFTLLEGLA